MSETSFLDKNVEAMKKQNIFHSRKVLVVEDDKNMTVLLGKVLLDLSNDIEIQWAESVEQALTHLIQNSDINEKSPYDLIIADIFLEGRGTGLDLFKVIRQTHPRIPFLVISSLESKKINEVLLQVGWGHNVMFLKKPFIFSDCKELIKNILMTTEA